MKKLIISTVLLFLSFTSAYACKDKRVSIDAVPANVMEAANFIAKGIQIEEVEYESEHGYEEYELVGILNNEEHEVEVVLDPEGNIVAIELENEDDDDHHHDDDDDISWSDFEFNKIFDLVKL